MRPRAVVNGVANQRPGRGAQPNALCSCTTEGSIFSSQGRVVNLRKCQTMRSRCAFAIGAAVNHRLTERCRRTARLAGGGTIEGVSEGLDYLEHEFIGSNVEYVRQGNGVIEHDTVCT